LGCGDSVVSVAWIWALAAALGASPDTATRRKTAARETPSDPGHRYDPAARHRDALR
jgi:hypothetical protein